MRSLSSTRELSAHGSWSFHVPCRADSTWLLVSSLSLRHGMKGNRLFTTTSRGENIAMDPCIDWKALISSKKTSMNASENQVDSTEQSESTQTFVHKVATYYQIVKLASIKTPPKGRFVDIWRVIWKGLIPFEFPPDARIRFPTNWIGLTQCMVKRRSNCYLGTCGCLEANNSRCRMIRMRICAMTATNVERRVCFMFGWQTCRRLLLEESRYHGNGARWLCVILQGSWVYRTTGRRVGCSVTTTLPSVIGYGRSVQVPLPSAKTRWPISSHKSYGSRQVTMFQGISCSFARPCTVSFQ